MDHHGADQVSTLVKSKLKLDQADTMIVIFLSINWSGQILIKVECLGYSGLRYYKNSRGRNCYEILTEILDSVA